MINGVSLVEGCVMVKGVLVHDLAKFFDIRVLGENIALLCVIQVIKHLESRFTSIDG